MRSCLVEGGGVLAASSLQLSRRSAASRTLYPHYPASLISQPETSHRAFESQQCLVTVKRSALRVRGALSACRTRRESVHGGSLAAFMPPRVPQPARTPHQEVGRWSVAKLLSVASLALGKLKSLQVALLSRCRLLGLRLGNPIERTMIRTVHTMHCLHQRTDHLAWSLPAHRRGTLRGMDAA